MSDTRFYYERMRGRARHLVERLDEVMAGLLQADRAVDEVMKADLDNPGELSPTEAADLRQALENALFSVRAAERIAVAHAADVLRAMRGSGLIGDTEIAGEVALQRRRDRGDHGLHLRGGERFELPHVPDHADADDL
jgi:hypothetical protein